MPRNNALLWVLAAAAGVVYFGSDQLKSMLITDSAALASRNVQAFLALIRKFEGVGRYDTLYHPPKTDPYYDAGAPLYFSGYATHPDIKIYFLNPRTNKRDWSTAAGAYQITNPTWRGLSVLPGAPSDFGPEAQDWYAVQLLKASGALAAIVAGEFERAAELAAATWAFLPHTKSKQTHITIARALEVYGQAGGVVA